MSENIELSYVWDHTIMKILNHDIQSKIGNMIKEWVVFNKLEDFNSLLKYTDDDFTPTGKLCYMNQNGEKLYRKLMNEFFNLRWYIQHLVDEYEYQYGDNERTNPLHESNWTYRTNKQFMKYVNFTLKEMTPEQMKMKPIKPIVKVNTNEVLDTEEGESNSDEQKSTISNEEEEEFTTSEELTEDECSTFSDMSKQDSITSFPSNSGNFHFLSCRRVSFCGSMVGLVVFFIVVYFLVIHSIIVLIIRTCRNILFIFLHLCLNQNSSAHWCNLALSGLSESATNSTICC